jgi:hypothetical protein
LQSGERPPVPWGPGRPHSGSTGSSARRRGVRPDPPYAPSVGAGVRRADHQQRRGRSVPHQRVERPGLPGGGHGQCEGGRAHEGRRRGRFARPGGRARAHASIRKSNGVGHLCRRRRCLVKRGTRQSRCYSAVFPHPPRPSAPGVAEGRDCPGGPRPVLCRRETASISRRPGPGPKAERERLALVRRVVNEHVRGVRAGLRKNG